MEKLTQNERELIQIINACEDKENAFMTAVTIICNFVKEYQEQQKKVG